METYFSIKLNGQQFKKSYLIYVIELSHLHKGRYFYVGQTGDRNYSTARPAFRRLAGHLSDQGHSTENQVFQQIARHILKLQVPTKKTFSSEVKAAVSDFLCDCEIQMHVFPLKEFIEEISPETHKANLDFVETVENNVIHQFIGKYTRERVLNKKAFPLTEKISSEIQKLTGKIMNKFPI